MKLLKTSLCITILSLASAFAQAEVAIVVHPSNTSEVAKTSLSRIFLGKAKNFSAGGKAVPITPSASSPATSEFNSKVLKKSSSQLKSYWSKLVFTGKGTPPKALSSDAEVISFVSSNPNAIGYIDAASVTSAVKVVGKY